MRFGRVWDRLVISCGSDTASGCSESAMWSWALFGRGVLLGTLQGVHGVAWRRCGSLWCGMVCVLGLSAMCSPANPRLAHKDSSNDPHIIHHLGPTDPSGHRRPRWPTKKVELYSGWELDVDNLPKQRIWIPSPADSPVCMECSGATSSVGRRRIHITHVWPQFNMSTLWWWK